MGRPDQRRKAASALLAAKRLSPEPVSKTRCARRTRSSATTADSDTLMRGTSEARTRDSRRAVEISAENPGAMAIPGRSHPRRARMPHDSSSIPRARTPARRCPLLRAPRQRHRLRDDAKSVTKRRHERARAAPYRFSFRRKGRRTGLPIVAPIRMSAAPQHDRCRSADDPRLRHLRHAGQDAAQRGSGATVKNHFLQRGGWVLIQRSFDWYRS
jgi:hypothetical protein